MPLYAESDSSSNSRVQLSRGLTLSIVPTLSICYHRKHALSVERYTFFDCIGEEGVAVCPSSAPAATAHAQVHQLLAGDPVIDPITNGLLRNPGPSWANARTA